MARTPLASLSYFIFFADPPSLTASYLFAFLFLVSPVLNGQCQEGQGPGWSCRQQLVEQVNDV